jgi:hypothetical protein
MCTIISEEMYLFPLENASVCYIAFSLSGMYCVIIIGTASVPVASE